MKAPYKKPDSVKELERLADAEARTKHPTCPHLAPRKYEDRTANGLCKCIIEFLRLKGHQAERISCTGRYVDNSKTVTDTLGFTKRIGSGKWIKASMQAGTADISATIFGRSVKVEIKVKSDKQRPEQVEYQKQVERAGGVYLIIASFGQFADWYNSLK